MDTTVIPEKAEFAQDMHPILVKFLNWSENWDDPEDCQPLPLRKLAPDAVDYLISACNFSTRDLKNLTETFQLGFDHRDKQDFFNRLLDRIEKAPWVWPRLEFEVIRGRVSPGKLRPPTRAEKDKIDRISAKFPINRLRLGLRPDLQERLSELAGPGPYPADLVVSIFFEYAIYHFAHEFSALSPDALATLTHTVLYGGQDETNIETLFAAASTTDDWIFIANCISGAYPPEHAVSDVRPGVIRALKGLAGSLDETSPAEAYDSLSDLAAIGALLAPDFPEQASENYEAELVDLEAELVDRLRSLGLDLPGSPQDQIELIRREIELIRRDSFEADLTTLEKNIASVSALKTEIADLRQRMTLLTATEDWDPDDAADIAAATSVKRQQHDGLQREIEALRARLNALLGHDIEEHTSTETTEAETIEEAIPEEAVLALVEAEGPDVVEAPEDVACEDEERVFPAQDEEDGSPDQVPQATLPGPIETKTALDAEVDTGTAEKAAGVEDETSGDGAELEPGLDTAPLRRLLVEDRLSIATELASAIEANGNSWEIDADTLRLAAATRVAHGDYGHDTDAIRSLATKAFGRERSDLGSALLFGGLVRPVVTRKSLHDLRGTTGDLCRGALGPHLMQVSEAIGALDYDFPPGPDVLARIAGNQGEAPRRRLARKLGEWCDGVARKTSRWAFATLFMHHVVGENGPLGRARSILESDRVKDIPVLREILERLDGTGEIDAMANEFALDLGKSGLKLHPKGQDYLDGLFEEARVLITEWIEASEEEATSSRKSEARMLQTVGNLKSRIGKAIAGLEDIGRSKSLEGTVASWIVRRLKETLEAIQGREVPSFASLDEALRADLDLLPAASRRDFASSQERLDSLWVLVAEGIPAPEEAIRRACLEGSFETASRIAARFGGTSQDQINTEMVSFAKRWAEEIDLRERRLKTLSKVDYDHQEELARHLSWCKIRRDELAEIARLEASGDLSDLAERIAELDLVAERIDHKVRVDQTARIRRYRNEQNAEDAEALLGSIDDLTVETIEDRIAQLRDGRSAAAFEIDLEGLVSAFTPGFVTAATAPDWPHTRTDYSKAFEKDGLLHVEENRRSAAVDYVSLYLDLQRSLLLGQPNTHKIRAFLEESRFESVRLSKLTQIGRAKAWEVSFSGRISSDGWFLPPIFGSLSKDSYNLILIAQDELAESIQKSLSRERPTLILSCGVADLSRRHDFAERLRSNAIPALFIDEALVAYTATRRETRSRTLFECGLPYGRVEPYTTDAGSIPPEMFFGRDKEIRTILSPSADGCLVYGGRQLGKSALLSHIARLHHDPNRDQIILRREVKSLGNSEKTSTIWLHLHSMLQEYGVVRPASRDYESVNRDIRNWLADHRHGRIICLFDETDHFMTTETRNDYPELSRLKDLMESTGRAFKVVFAGLHNVKRIHRQPNSPLAHLGQAICIGPLNQTEDDKRAAHDLVVQPMRAAGFKFESVEAVEEILAWANYYPSLIQEYAKGLLSTLHGAGSGKVYRLDADGPLWMIPSSELFTHRGFQQIETRVREKFHLTLELDPRYALVAYTLAWLNAEGYEHQALVTGFTAGDLFEHAKGFWPRLSEEPSQAAFDVLLDELFELGVLGRVPIANSNRFTYCLRTRQVAAMLGAYDDISHALAEIHDKEPTVAYDRAIHRRRFGQPGRDLASSPRDWLYSPLTDLQIERLLKSDRTGVRFVCGLDTLGLSKVAPALRWFIDQGSLPGRQKNDPQLQIEIVESQKAMTTVVDRGRIPPRTQVILVRRPETAKQAEQEIRWLEERSKVRDGEIIPVILADALDPEMRDLVSRRFEQAEYLTAWGSEMLRVHLHNVERTIFDNPRHRNEILRKTGGIPSEIVALVDKMAAADLAEDVLGDWKVSDKLAKSLADSPIAQALDGIMEATTEDEYKIVDEFVRNACGIDLISIGPDLQAIGLISGWNPKNSRIRLSALGELVSRQFAT